VFEKALQNHKVSVPIWEAYLKYCVQHNEECTNSVFERAYSCVGQSPRSAEIWMLWIDFEWSFLHMAKCHLLGFLAIKTPMIDHERVINK
jgi:hypothetical protein